MDTIVSQFPHPAISPIIETFNYQSIATLHLKFNVNVVSFLCGDDKHAILILMVSDVIYISTTGQPFIQPDNPGAHPSDVELTNATDSIDKKN